MTELCNKSSYYLTAASINSNFDSVAILSPYESYFTTVKVIYKSSLLRKIYN